MSKRSLFLGCLAGFILLCFDCFAETIYLKTGKKVRGQVLERNAQQIKVEISGVKVTYFMDEVDHIEEAAIVESAPPLIKTEPLDVQPILEKKQTDDPMILEVPVKDAVSPVINVDTSFPESPSEKTPAKADTVAVSTSQEETSSPVPMKSVVSSNPLTDQKKEIILDLIEASGTKDTMVQMFAQIIEQAPADQIDVLKKVLNIDEIISRLVPVYDKYFSDEELKELIAFYKGATGRKLIEVMPLIMEDSMTASEVYFQEKMPAVENQTPKFEE